MSKEREVSEGGGSGGAINARKRPSGSREDLEDDAGIGHTNNRRPVAVASAVSSPLSPSGALVPFAAISNNHRSSNNMQHHQQLQHGGGSAGAAAAAAAAAAAIVTPCAACKLLRRRCAQECPFAPYFSPHEPHKFACVHKIYGASNVSKMLMEVPESQRADTANSLVYEANARIRDPVYGCMGVISALQQQARSLQAELSAVKAEVMRYRASHAENAALMQIAAAVNSPFTNNNAPNNPTLNPASNSPSLVQPPDNITYISNSTNSATSADSSIKNERFWSTLG